MAAIRRGRSPVARAIPGAGAQSVEDRSSARALDMDAFVPALLTNLAQKISASASAEYRPRFGVGITDWRILSLLAGEPWIAPARICDRTGLDKAAVSRSLRVLIADGLVEIRDRSRRRRGMPAALTAKGLALHDELAEAARAREARLLEGFSAVERKALLEFLGRLANAAADMRAPRG